MNNPEYSLYGSGASVILVSFKGKATKSMSQIAQTPAPPYYAVIFTNYRTEGDHGYAAMADRMVELAQQQPGFLGVESARDGVGITVSYWETLDAIKHWKSDVEHQAAQRLGREHWYSEFRVRIAKVEREYGL